MKGTIQGLGFRVSGLNSLKEDSVGDYTKQY